MSIQYIERMGSRTLARTSDSYTASRTFLVYDDAGGNVSIQAAVNFGSGVHFSDTHPDINGIFANGFSTSASAERSGTWELTWTYAQPKDDDDAGGDNDPFGDDGDNTEVDPDVSDPLIPPDDDGDGGGGGDDDVGDDGVDEGDDGIPDDDGNGETTRRFTGYSINATVALVDGYVAGASIPDDGNQGGDEGYEIDDGTIVHKGGRPVTIPVCVTSIAVSETVFGSVYYLNNTNLKAGMRNSSNFYGFDSGSVLFTGMSVQRQDVTIWDVTYNFSWDEWSHMRQVPNRNDDGDIDPVEGVLQIYFKQPFPSTTSFGFSP